MDVIFESENELAEALANATGNIGYGLRNDYMFHMVVGHNEEVQIGLISALLHIPKSKINSVEIRNPIEIGEHISDKTFVLDMKILLNNNQILNIEVQVTNQGNWTDRSLQYLCREFDQLNSGQQYEDTLPVTHIGIIDFELFEDCDEFYSKYRLMNVKTHRIYNSKFELNVLSLGHIDNASEEDKEWELDKWASLFKATTWEEIKAIGKYSTEFAAAGREMFRMNAFDKVRWECEQREQYERHERTVQRDLRLANERADAEHERADAEHEIAVAEKERADAEHEIAMAEKERADAAEAEIARLKQLLESK